MKLILISCILLFSFRSSAQGVDVLVEEALSLFQKEEYGKAIPMASRAATEVEKLMGRDNVIYQALLTIEAESNLKIFEYTKSEKLYLKLCNIHKQSRTSTAQNYITCLNNLAIVYKEMGLYDKAESALVESMDRAKNIPGNDTGYAYVLHNLATTYHEMGQFQKSEPLYLKALEIRKKIYGENHENYATSLNNIGTLYEEMGQAEKAEPIFIKVNEIRKRTTGESTMDYAMSLNNLGVVYEVLKQYAKAESYYIQANAIRKKLKGEVNLDYAIGLNNLGSLYTATGQYKKAEPLIIQAKNIWKVLRGETHPEYATGLNNQATFYLKSKNKMQYPQAEYLYKQAIDIRRKSLGINHPNTADSEIDLALLYASMGQYAKAEPYLLLSTKSVLQNMLSSFTVLSEKEKGNYLDQKFDYTECSNSFLYNYPSASAEIIRNSLNLQLGFKSLSLSDTKNVLESVRNSKDTAIKKLLMNWQVNKLLLAKQYALPVESRLSTLVSIEAETESLEKELNRRSSVFRDQQTAIKVSLKEMQAKLEADEAAIEFVRFRLYTDHFTDTIIYAAYVIRKNDAVPVFVKLCNEIQLQELFDKAGENSITMVNSFYRSLGLRGKSSGGMGRDLYNLIWLPLEPYLKGIKKISYSPVGKFHSIAFHALSVDSSTILIDKYRLAQYTSIRQIALRNSGQQSNKPGSIVLFGDAMFTMDSTEISQRSNKSTDGNISKVVYTGKSRGERGGVWKNLPGTAEEVKLIGKLFEQENISTKSYVQMEASEENLKALNGKAPQILHVATHGFFLPAPDKSSKERGANTYKLSEDPLMRSGLVMAGGNYVWSGRNPLNGVEDGIATAYEISQLNLTNTDLVVLSACETALGDIKGSEGVFGLQRSFKMAGVKNLVVSLWQVPDKETVELMTAFYSYRMQGKNITEAFFLAQSEMRKKYTPFYWAAFVLVE